jgi:hypothetical protein
MWISGHELGATQTGVAGRHHAWAETQPWCQAMADCAQDAEWHSEGDVWTHTQMVLRQLLELEEWPSLTPHEQIVLIFTALFHDVAKPLTTEVIRRRASHVSQARREGRTCRPCRPA